MTTGKELPFFVCSFFETPLSRTPPTHRDLHHLQGRCELLAGVQKLGGSEPLGRSLASPVRCENISSHPQTRRLVSERQSEPFAWTQCVHLIFSNTNGLHHSNDDAVAVPAAVPPPVSADQLARQVPVHVASVPPPLVAGPPWRAVFMEAWKSARGALRRGDDAPSVGLLFPPRTPDAAAAT